MDTVGSILKTSRKLKNISLESIADELKISKDILERFEDDKIVQDKDIIFYIGHLRSYSNFLNLNSKEIIIKFKYQIGYNKINVEKIQKPKFNNYSYTFQKFFSISLIIIVFSGFYILFINRDDNFDRNYALVPDLPDKYIPIIEKADVSEVIEKNTDNNFKVLEESFNYSNAIASNKIITSDKNDTITLKLTNPTWLQLRDKMDNIILSKLMVKNDEFTYNLDLEYSITAGNAGNILVLINSDVRGKIGKYGEVVDSLILDYNFNN